jgi:hypothetical protein
MSAEQDPSDYIPPGSTIPEFAGRQPAPYEWVFHATHVWIELDNDLRWYNDERRLAEKEGQHILETVEGSGGSVDKIEAQTILKEGSSSKPTETLSATNIAAKEEGDKAWRKEKIPKWTNYHVPSWLNSSQVDDLNRYDLRRSLASRKTIANTRGLL